MKRSKPLNRSTGLRRSSQLKKGKGFAASKRQRIAVENLDCLVCGGWNPDPAHLCARAQGGCDEPLCVVPLCRTCHRAFDAAELDILPHLIPHYREGVQHALGHYNGDLIALLQRLTGVRWVPVENDNQKEAAA